MGQDDADCVVDEDSEHEGGGLRQLDVFCVDDDVVVADEEALRRQAGRHPQCLATTVVVDPIEGNDLNDGTAENPLKTLRACIKRFGKITRRRRKLPHDDGRAVRRCATACIDRGADAVGRRRPVLVKPLNDGDVVITAPIRCGAWSGRSMIF